MTARIRIRPLSTDADCAACVELQHLVWGAAGGETVPPIILLVSQKVGAIAAGAFEPGGRMLGCVFGLTGLRDGRLAHWSHILAVRPEARDRGIGRRLKLYQRGRLRAMGVDVMYWTYDPLVARNAHLNLNRLGVTVEEYVPHLYPGRESPLDRVIGTDRFVVRWDLNRQRPLRAKRLSGGRTAQIEIPPDIHGLRDRDPKAARRWRETTRAEFQRYLKRGYRVAAFESQAREGRCFYVLRKAPR